MIFQVGSVLALILVWWLWRKHAQREERSALDDYASQLMELSLQSYGPEFAETDRSQKLARLSDALRRAEGIVANRKPMPFEELREVLSALSEAGDVRMIENATPPSRRGLTARALQNLSHAVRKRTEP
ncbi:hypothetical protein [Brevundimonas sp.]|jgi:hypothetical protein|uniref:hypothetical protein n=1 Tax=Brevundimonas sp. TaxID=1871086 RepID=UPI003918E95D